MTDSPLGALPTWRRVLNHPIVAGVAIWLYLPVGLVLLALNPVLQKDRRWWAGSAVWALYLLWAGRLPLVSSSPDSPVAASSTSANGKFHQPREASWEAETATSSEIDSTNGYYKNGYAYGLEMAEACKRLARGSLSTGREQAAKWRSELVQTIREAHPQQADLVNLTAGKLQGLIDGLVDTSLLP